MNKNQNNVIFLSRSCSHSCPCCMLKVSNDKFDTLTVLHICILWFNSNSNFNLIRVYSRKQGWLDLPDPGSNLSNSHSPSRSNASSFFKPTLLLSFSTCIFHVFGCPRFLLPFTSNSNAFLKTCPSSLLNTCPYHLTPFAFASETPFKLIF